VFAQDWQKPFCHVRSANPSGMDTYVHSRHQTSPAILNRHGDRTMSEFQFLVVKGKTRYADSGN
jgi:hypothetical protein